MGEKAIVIGSGVGGAAAGALLAARGYEVEVLESNRLAGGRCASMRRDGFTVDFGVHMFSRGDSGPHGMVNRAVGGDLSWITRDPPCRVMGKREFDYPLDVRPLLTQAGVARKLGVRPRNYVGAARLFRSLMAGRGVEENEGVVLRDYVSRFTDDEMVHLFMNCVCQLYFAVSYLQASAGEFIWSFTRMFNDASFGYPRGASGAIPGSFLAAVERRGGRVGLGEPVKSILVEGGRVRGVETERRELAADLVVSNAGIRRTIDLAGRASFPEEYVSAAHRYSDSNAYVTVKLALERKVVPYPVVFYMPDLPPEKVFSHLESRTVPVDPYIFMPVPTNHDPSLAPEGMQLVIAGTAVPADASPELCESILDLVYRKVLELFPGIENEIAWQSRTVSDDTRELTAHDAGECIGLAQVPGQVGGSRPALRTPVEGLWLVGADAGARGIGTEMASGSALNLLEALAASG